MKYSFLYPVILLLALISMISCKGDYKNYSRSSVTETKSLRELDTELKKIFPPDKPGAAIIAYKEGKVLFRKSYGLANVELQVPIQPDMIFKIGSMSKQFTAVSIMILKERGLLSLDDPIHKFFPYYSENSHTITIRNLLSHTSGIKNYNDIPVFNSFIKDQITPDEMINIVKKEPLGFIPGDKLVYSNSGYILLARIVEIISNQPFDQFVTQYIFEPAGMKKSIFYRDYEIVPNHVDGYRMEDEKLLKTEFMSMTHTYGGGEISTNVDDLVLWMDALLKNKLISSESLQTCFTPFILNNGKATDYGLGWFCGYFDDYKELYHGGGVYGFVSYGMFLPEEKIYVAVLRNSVDPYTSIPTNIIGEMVAGVLLGIEEQSEERTAIQLLPDQLNRYVGVYQFDSGGKRRISLSDNSLYYEIPPRKKENPWNKTEILPESKDLFFAEGRKSTITFHFDDSDNITGFIVNQPFGRKVAAKKIK